MGQGRCAVKAGEDELSGKESTSLHCMAEPSPATLVGALVNTVIPEWGRTLNDNELHAHMMGDTFVGGAETTTNAISAGIMLLAEHPRVWGTLKCDPARCMRPMRRVR